MSNLNNNESLIVVSNRVPYNIVKTRKGIRYKKSVGGLVTALDPILSTRGGLWIGWNGMVGRTRQVEKKVKVKEGKNETGYELKFINLTKQDVKNYYHGFSNRTLWPLFHGFIFQTYFDIEYWKSYQRVNKKFADEVLEDVKGNEFIWVQDYHLTLLPKLLRDKNPNLKLLYFLHTPFPCHEIFRLLPWGRQILEGLLGCDLVGFQTRRDAQNFLYSCKEIIKSEVDFNSGSVRFDSREVSVKSFPISIDYNRFRYIAQRKETDKFCNKIRKANENTRLIISVERLDYTKGIKERLFSIERFFEKYPVYRKKVIFIQISVPSRTKIKEYIEFKREIDELVGRINGRFAEEMWSPINYIYQVVPQPKLIAFYKASDICMVTPLRDGMNLIAKEYVSSKPNGNGILILSNFTGSADEMKQHSLVVNPYDIEEVADSIDKALSMPLEEKKKKIFALQKVVRKNDVFNWSSNFLDYYLKAAS